MVQTIGIAQVYEPTRMRLLRATGYENRKSMPLFNYGACVNAKTDLGITDNCAQG
jgi:hypothetical protein